MHLSVNLNVSNFVRQDARGRAGMFQAKREGEAVAATGAGAHLGVTNSSDSIDLIICVHPQHMRQLS